MRIFNSAKNIFQQRKTAIVGAGQAGLQLGLELLLRGHKEVSIFDNRSAEQVRKGRILSSQGMFHSAIEIETKLGLGFWANKAPKNESISFTLTKEGLPEKMIDFSGVTYKPYQSIDQREKFSYWRQVFERLGGKLHIIDVGLEELDRITNDHELTIVAGGKGEISQAFPKNNIRSHFDKPQRILSCLYVNGVLPDTKNRKGVHVNIIPGIGEFFLMPGLALGNQPCEMMLFEGIPNGPFDCWNDVKTPEEQLSKALELLKTHLPWVAERCKRARLTDKQATLKGSYTPVVRHPVILMPSGKYVLAMADTAVLNDPIAGQGANNAAKAAHLYAARISEHRGELDEKWMHETFNKYWHQYAKWATKWSHLLLMPPKPHMIALLQAAESSPSIANMLADGFDDPSTLFPWIMHAEDTLKVIHEIQASEQMTNETLYFEKRYSYALNP